MEAKFINVVGTDTQSYRIYINHINTVYWSIMESEAVIVLTNKIIKTKTPIEDILKLIDG